MTQDTSQPEATLPELLKITSEPQQSQAFTAPIEELDDEDFAPPPPRRTSRVTFGLTALAVLALGFLGGALVQKHEGTATTAAAGGRAGRARGTGAFAGLAEGGTGAGGFGGFGAAGGTGTGAGTAAGTGAAGATGTTGAAAAPAGPTPIAIGTVVSISGNTLVVKDLGGTTHTLTIGTGVTLSTSTPFTATSLKPGEAVTVDGTTGTTGASTVTTVVRRS